MKLPDAFVASLRVVTGNETEKLLASLDDPQPVSIRCNPDKWSGVPDGERVPWCDTGRYLNVRPSFTLDPLFHAGV